MNAHSRETIRVIAWRVRGCLKCELLQYDVKDRRLLGGAVRTVLALVSVIRISIDGLWCSSFVTHTDRCARTVSAAI
jgi:hypothetical protein